MRDARRCNESPRLCRKPSTQSSWRPSPPSTHSCATLFEIVMHAGSGEPTHCLHLAWVSRRLRFVDYEHECVHMTACPKQPNRLPYKKDNEISYAVASGCPFVLLFSIRWWRIPNTDVRVRWSLQDAILTPRGSANHIYS